VHLLLAHRAAVLSQRHLLDVRRHVQLVAAADVHRVHRQQRAGNEREGHVEVDAKLLTARHVHVQVVHRVHTQEQPQLADEQHADGDDRDDRHYGAAERLHLELLVQLRVCKQHTTRPHRAATDSASNMT